MRESLFFQMFESIQPEQPLRSPRTLIRLRRRRVRKTTLHPQALHLCTKVDTVVSPTCWISEHDWHVGKGLRKTGRQAG